MDTNSNSSSFDAIKTSITTLRDITAEDPLVIRCDSLWTDIKVVADRLESSPTAWVDYIDEQLAYDDNANTPLYAFLKNKSFDEIVNKVTARLRNDGLQDLAIWDDQNRKIIYTLIGDEVTREFLSAYLLERGDKFATTTAYDGLIQSYDKRADSANVQFDVELATEASAVSYVDVAAAVITVVLVVLAVIVANKQPQVKLGMTPSLLRGLSSQIMDQVGKLTNQPIA